MATSATSSDLQVRLQRSNHLGFVNFPHHFKRLHQHSQLLDLVEAPKRPYLTKLALIQYAKPVPNHPLGASGPFSSWVHQIQMTNEKLHDGLHMLRSQVSTGVEVVGLYVQPPC